MNFKQARKKVFDTIDLYYESYIYFRIHKKQYLSLLRGIDDARKGRFYKND
jgi:hypothetical protein